MHQSPNTCLLSDRDVPALLGLDPHRSRWTLWQIATGRYHPHADTARVPPLGEALHEPLVAEIARHGHLGVPARRPTRRLRHRTLPLEGAPDLVIPKGEMYGAGFGFALVVATSHSAWYRHWHGTQPAPIVPPDITARLAALFVLSGAQWALVLPQINWAPPRAPLLVRPDPDLQDQIIAEIHRFVESLAQHEAPAPDARADRHCLAAVARAAPSPHREPFTLNHADTDAMRALIEEINTTRDTLAEHEANLAPAREHYRGTMARLTALITERGPICLDDHVYTIRVEDAPPRRRDEQRVHLTVHPNASGPSAAPIPPGTQAHAAA